MPAAIPIIAYYAAAYVGTSLLVASLVSFAAAAAVGEHQRKKAARAARDAQRAALDARTTMLAMISGPSSRVYGQVRNVDGVLFKAVRDQGSDRIYTLVVQIAGHKVKSIGDIYFNDVKVTLDAQGWVTTAPYGKTTRTTYTEPIELAAGAGSVTLPHTPVAGSVSVYYTETDERGTITTKVPFTVTGNTVTANTGTGQPVSYGATVSYQSATFTSYARVRKYTGGAAQDLSTVLQPLFPSLITADDKFAGPAVLLVDLTRNPDAFPTGVPSISAVMEGADDVVDPRTGLAGYTQNPAVMARDWSLHAFGGGMVAAQLDDASFIAAANACDTSTVFTRPGGDVTLPLYQGGMVCRYEGDPTAYLDEMVEAMAGRWAFAGGRLRVVAGTYRPPVLTIDEGWLSDAGSIETVKDAAAADLVNSYTATIADREAGYQVQPMPAVRPAAYLAADGAEYSREISMQAVTHSVHAQHICGVLLRDSRDGLRIELPLKMHALPVEVFDTVNLSLPRYGYEDKVFEVLGTSFSLTGGVRLRLKETAAAIYEPDAAFLDSGYAQNTALPLPWEVPEVIGLAVTSGTAVTDTLQPVTRVMVGWLPITSGLANQVEIQWRDVSGEPSVADWINAAGQRGGWVNAAGDLGGWVITATEPDVWQSLLVDAKSSSATLPALKPGRVYNFRARALRTAVGATTANATGGVVRSDWSVQVTHQVSTQPLIGPPQITPDSLTRDVRIGTPFAIGGQLDLSGTQSTTQFEVVTGEAWEGSITLAGERCSAVVGGNFGVQTGQPIASIAWLFELRDIDTDDVLDSVRGSSTVNVYTSSAWKPPGGLDGEAWVPIVLRHSYPTAQTGTRGYRVRIFFEAYDAAGDHVTAFGNPAVPDHTRAIVRGGYLDISTRSR